MSLDSLILSTRIIADDSPVYTPLYYKLTEEGKMPVKKTESTEPDVWADDNNAPDWAADKAPVSDRDMITISLKGGSGTQAWIVGHFNSVDEAIEVLTDDDSWSILMELTAKRGNDLVEAHGGSAPKAASRASAASSGRSNSSWGKSSGGSQRSSRKGKVTEDEDGFSCKHGEAVERSGEKNGKRWSGMFCPSSDRNDQCDPIWD